MFLQVRFGDCLLEQSDNACLLRVYFSVTLFEQDIGSQSDVML